MSRSTYGKRRSSSGDELPNRLAVVSILAVSILLALYVSFPGTAIARPSIDYARFDDGADLSIIGVSCIFEDEVATPQPGYITVTLTSREHTTRRTFDPCWRYKHLHASGWGWRATIAAPERDWPAVHIRVTRRTSGQVRVRYRVAVAGALIETGVLSTRVHWYPGHDVYEGTDEFVNYCIDESRTVYSRGGRLYCHWPGFVTRRTAISPDHA